MLKSSESINISGENEKNSGLVLIIMQEQCGKELSTRKQYRGMYPHDLYFSEISSKMTETTRV